MKEYWEDLFKNNQTLWGFEPARSAMLAKDFFVGKGLKNILIPGIGYGRNAQVFRENGMTVTGIEIAKTAIELAHKQHGEGLIIHHGSVTNMPFDNHLYDGIFCYALIHLLDTDERQKLITDCYNQLSAKGYMIFAVVSSKAPMYGRGTLTSPHRYEISEGIKIFFYDKESIESEFKNAGLIATTEVEDIYPFYLITCQKGE